MADNFLERHREQYEARKAAWLRKKKHLPKLKAKAAFPRPDDEALSSMTGNKHPKILTEVKYHGTEWQKVPPS